MGALFVYFVMGFGGDERRNEPKQRKWYNCDRERQMANVIVMLILEIQQELYAIIFLFVKYVHPI